ncbi:PAS-domain containing protein [Roseivivax isoporae]|uniref:Sensory/regulatory protein RpfC n=1 Tax=Roseivivax isoporae LMG 25204 TaxID=1449351 RepID=X7F440_9RHOB|nr:PAS-domain containing protein [Roseivivax isoporae]ETX27677.1 sensor histidine kinase [Roseivivax isoporae LMG 25204]
MTLAQALAEERRARLAAERLLEQKRRELTEANRKLGLHARELSDQITETRARVATVEDENMRVLSKLGAAHEKIAVVEGQLWQALGSIRDGFALWSAQGLLELANRAYLSVFDNVSSAGIGAHYSHLVALMVEEGIADLQGMPPAEWTAMMHAGWEAEALRPVTIRLWTGQFVKMINRRTPGGGVVSLVVDMTDLMRMWSAVQELPDGFVLYDAEDRLVTCNARYRALYAASAPAMTPGTPFEDILRHGLAHGQYADAAGHEEEWLEQRLAQRRNPQTVLEQELGDGRWLRVFEKQTSDGGRVGLRVDITDLKRVQRDLERATERAEAANRAKSAFLANMSHEIRTPMNGVVGMAELLMETALSDEQRLFAETIRNSGEALLALINDVLDYSKIEAERMVLRAEGFDLEAVLLDVFVLLQPAARAKGLAMLLDYDMDLPARFVGDAARIRQVLTNLLGNAVKFTPRGHVLARVTGRPQGRGTLRLSLSVEDTGIGIPADRIEHVFGEFNQVEDDRNRQFEGTGLGLAITRRLIALMGGEIWVRSDVGRGSCFGVTLDLPAEAEAEPARPSLPRVRHALLVDPSAPAREIVARQLGALGIPVTACADAEAALAAAGSGDPDLLLVARQVGEVAGAALARRLQAGPGRPPALLLASLLDPPVTVPGDGALGGTVTLPAPRRALLSALARVLDRSMPPGTMPPAAPGPVAVEDAGGPAVPDILVAEDNRTNQLVFRKMVAGRRLDLRFAANGIEAVEAFRTRRPDLVFMDISMPQMDGKEATRRIRALEHGRPPVPIIAVTAHALEGDRDAILAAGLDGYLTKPLRKDALLAVLDRYCTAPPVDA